MIKEALSSVMNYRKDLNDGDIQKINSWISDDFIGYFGYYNDRDYKIYRGESYKIDNIKTFKEYEGKNPRWIYIDLANNMRSTNEIILSSIVEFYLFGEKVASVLAMEVFKKEKNKWKLYRQHMERYRD